MIRCKSCFMIVHDVFQVVNPAKFWHSPNLINTPKSQPHLEDLPFGVRRLIPWIFRIFGIWFPQILRFHFHQIHWFLHSLPRLNFQDLAGFIVASWHLREQLCCRFVELRCLFLHQKSHFTSMSCLFSWRTLDKDRNSPILPFQTWDLQICEDVPSLVVRQKRGHRPFGPEKRG